MTSDTRTNAAKRGSAWFDRLSLAFVLLVWLECLLATQIFIATFAARTPYADDTSLFVARVGQGSFFQYLWALHNEHRLPIPKLVQYALYDWTGDVRSGMYAEAHVYGCIALGCILVARSLRGSTRPWDAFFPLMWLQLGNSENLLMGFQLCIAIPAACVCTVFVASALSTRRLWPSRAIPSGVALILLPLCGGSGFLQAPVLGSWLAWLGWSNRNHPDPRERRGAWIYLGCVVLALALCAAYLVGFRRPDGADYRSDAASPIWKVALALISAPFGPRFERWSPFAHFGITIAVGVMTFVFFRRARREFDPRAVGVLAVLLGSVFLAVAMAIGRPIEGEYLFALRYVALPAPLYVALTLGALAILSHRWRECALAVCFAIMVFGTRASIRQGLYDGAIRRADQRELDRLVETRAGMAKLRTFYAERFLFGQIGDAQWLLECFLRRNLPPFDRGGHDAMAPAEYPSFATAPLVVRFEVVPENRVLDGEPLTYVRPPTTFEFPVRANDDTFRCEVGVPAILLSAKPHAGVRARCVLHVEGSTDREVGKITLDPKHVASERGLLPFEFHWEKGHAGRLSLTFEQIPSPDDPRGQNWVAIRKVCVD